MQKDSVFFEALNNEFLDFEPYIKNPNQTALGLRVRNIRRYKRLTQKEAAEKAGMQEALWRHYELGIKTPKAAQLQKIAAALQVPTEMLHPTMMHLEEAMASVYYDMHIQFGDVDITEEENGVCLHLNTPQAHYAIVALQEIHRRFEAISNEEIDAIVADLAEEKRHEEFWDCEPELDTIKLCQNEARWQLENAQLIDYALELYQKDGNQ